MRCMVALPTVLKFMCILCYRSALLGVVPIEEGKIAIITPLVRGTYLYDLIFDDKHRKVRSLSCSAIFYAWVVPYRGMDGSFLIYGSGISRFTCSFQQLLKEEKFVFCIPVCQAVVFLHTHSPVMAHLDIKPANIMVSYCVKNKYM